MKPKIVLYYPRHKDPELGVSPSFDLLPLEMLHVGALPDSEGYEVVIIDGNLYAQVEAQRIVLEHARDALVFGTTAVLGYAVTDGHQVARTVRAECPHVTIIAGGWFPSCLPRAYLESGVYDAVCLGQGELTMMELIRAVECGEGLESVPGLALWRDGQVITTPRRQVVGWGRLPRAAWHLIDIEPYRERQLRPGAWRAKNRFPPPPSKRRLGEPNYFGISYFSSYGCPEPCAFCCSPELTGRRWKAMAADDMLDDLEELQERWGFDVVRFHDANWGVDPRRARAFAEGLLERGIELEWAASLETQSILRYGRELVSLLTDSGLYLANVGAEAAMETTMARIGKSIRPGDNLEAVTTLHDHGILGSVSYIIGYPDEPRDSMLATLEQARQVLAAAPSATVVVFPFCPIPGNPMYRDATRLGFRPPEHLEEWGAIVDYQVTDMWPGNIPGDVRRIQRLFSQYAAFHHGIVRRRDGMMERLARWRIRTGSYQLPLDLKAYHVLAKVFGWGAKKARV